MSITSVSAVVCSFDFKSFFLCVLIWLHPAFYALFAFFCLLLFLHFFLFVCFGICLLDFVYLSLFCFYVCLFLLMFLFGFYIFLFVYCFFVMFAHLYFCFTLPSTSGCQALVDPSVLKTNLAIGRLERIIDRKSLLD